MTTGWLASCLLPMRASCLGDTCKALLFVTNSCFYYLAFETANYIDCKWGWYPMSLPLFWETDLSPSHRQMAKSIEATFWYPWEQRKLIIINSTQDAYEVWSSKVSQQLRSSGRELAKHKPEMEKKTRHAQHMTLSRVGCGGFVQGLWALHWPSPWQPREQPISIQITSVFVQFPLGPRKYSSLCLSWNPLPHSLRSFCHFPLISCFSSISHFSVIILYKASFHWVHSQKCSHHWSSLVWDSKGRATGPGSSSMALSVQQLKSVSHAQQG